MAHVKSATIVAANKSKKDNYMERGTKYKSMLTTKEAIDNRRSIRSFKTDPIPTECFNELLHAARLAPSGCNAQPWRFKIVTEQPAKSEIAEAAYNQSFILLRVYTRNDLKITR